MPVARAAEAEASATDARLDQLFGEHAAFHAFLDELKVAVAADDRPKVAGLVSYPLRTRIEGHAVRLRTPEDFLAHYDALISPATRSRIAAQTYAGLFANGHGAMIGDGQVWFASVCPDPTCTSRSVRIIGLNP